MHRLPPLQSSLECSTTSQRSLRSFLRDYRLSAWQCLVLPRIVSRPHRVESQSYLSSNRTCFAKMGDLLRVEARFCENFVCVCTFVRDRCGDRGWSSG